MPSNQSAFPNIATNSFGLKRTKVSFNNRGGGMKQDPGIKQIHATMANVIKHVRGNLTKIRKIQKDVDEQKSVNQHQNEQLTTLIDSVQGISAALGRTNAALHEFATADRQTDEAELDTQKDKVAADKKKNAEAELEGPKKIQNQLGDAVNKGVDTVGEKAIGFLDRIKKFFLVIVGGWFTAKTIDLINAKGEGNTEMVNKIGKQLLVGVAAVGSVFAIATFGLGTVLSSIGSLIAVVGGLLLNPVTLTALLIALGVGGAIMGMMKAFSWFRQKKAGGKELRDAHKKNREKLKEMKEELGIAKDGKIKNADGKWVDVMEHGTDEQKAAWTEFKKEEGRLNGIRDDMKDEIKKKKKEYFKEVRANEPSKKDGRKEYWKEARAEWKKTEEEIRNKHVSRIDSGADPDSVLKSKANDKTISSSVKDKATNISQEVNTEGETIVLPVKQDNVGTNAGSAKNNQGGTIKAENMNDRAVLATKIQLNAF